MHKILCDICGSDDSQVLFDKGRNNEQVTNVICQQCGLVYINPRADVVDVKNQYTEGIFSLIARGNYQPTQKKIVISESAALTRFLRLSKRIDFTNGDHTKRCLEIGCGIGSFLWFMHGAGWNGTGLEPDSNYASVGEEIYGVSILPQLYEHVGERPDHYDLIASFHVLEHVLSPKAFLQKARRELKTSGLIYIEVPCIDRPYDGDLERFFWSVHLTSFSKNTLSGLLQDVGFELLQVEYVDHFLSIIAQKNDFTEKQPLSFPLDNPSKLFKQVHRKYHRFRFLKNSSLNKVTGKVNATFSRTTQILRDEPDSLVPYIQRGVRRFQIEKISPMMREKTAVDRVRSHYLTHYGMHVPGNAGDTMLFEAVRNLIDNVNGNNRWSLEPVWDAVTDATVERLNHHASGIVIGGGGLLLRDTNANQTSGWQWGCGIEQLRQIQVPIIVFAIGYNRFRDQPDFEPLFKENIRQLVEQAAFFSLRNNGSIRALSAYLTAEQAEKLIFQPCPTTMLRYFYPQYAGQPDESTNRQLALNIAFDRHHLRFDGRSNQILTAVSRSIKQAANQGWVINLAIHRKDDANIIPWLLKENVPFNKVMLDGRSSRQVLKFYQHMSLTVGMRGHSQMIPFGLGNPIISLISHDKLGYFLEDIQHPEWGIDVKDINLEKRLTERIAFTGRNDVDIRSQITVAQEELWQITNANLIQIKEALNA